MAEMIELKRECVGGDGRVICLQATEDGLEVLERLTGPACQIVYEEDGHIHAVRLRGPEVSAVVARALCAESASAEGLAAALVLFFAEEGQSLLDLEDFLDARRIPYAYSASVGGAEVVRPEGCGM